MDEHVKYILLDPHKQGSKQAKSESGCKEGSSFSSLSSRLSKTHKTSTHQVVNDNGPKGGEIIIQAKKEGMLPMSAPSKDVWTK